MFIATEALDFQAKSKLGDELTDFFQAAIDYRDKLDLSADSTKTFIQYWNKHANELGVIVSRNANFKVTNVKSSAYPSMCFAILMELGKAPNRDLQTIMHEYSGIVKTGSGKIDRKQLEAIAESYSTSTGKLGVNSYNGDPLTAKLYFDPYVAFLTRHVLHKDLPTFTARELAAVELHETGHFTTVVEHCADRKRRMNELSLAVKQFLESAPFDEQVDYLLDQMEKNKAITKSKDYDAAIDILKGLKVANNHLQTMSEGFIKNKWIFLLGRIMVWLLVLHLTGFGVSSIVNKLVVEGAISAAISLNTLYGPSDFVPTKSDIARVETLADEFATRNGFGTDIVTALGKFPQIASAIGLLGSSGTINSDSIRSSKLVFGSFLVNRALAWVFDSNGMQYMHGYEPARQRAARVREQMIKVFTNDRLPENMRDIYLEQFDRLQDYLYPSAPSKKIIQTMINFGEWIRDLNPLRLVTLITSGDLPTDLDRLYNDLKALDANELFVSAAKLSKIIGQLKR